MSYYEDELALREAQINRKRKRNRKRLLVGAGVAAGGALALNNDKIRNKVTDHLRSDSPMMNNIGNGVRKVGKGIYNNFKPSATTMSIKRGTERVADAISNYAPKYNKRRRKLANVIDDIYHSGYSDGYYDSMELCHADDSETSEEDREKARRRRRRRNIALGVAGAAGVAAGGYAIGRALRKRGTPRLTGPKLTRIKVDPRDVETPIGWDFKRNKPKYASDDYNRKQYEIYEELKKRKEYDHDAKQWRYKYGRGD